MLLKQILKKYDAYKDSGIEWIGEIPQEWKFAKLAWCSNFINGYAFNSENMDIDGAVPVVRIGDIQNNRVQYETCLKVDNSEELKPYELKVNDIVIAMSGATTGKLAVICDNKQAYINQRVGIIRSKYNKFIRYCLDNESFMQYVALLSAGSAQPNISMGNILDYKIPYISEDEQQQIADYLDKKCGEIDRVVESEKKIIEKLKEYKQSVITEAVTKGLDKSAPLKDSGIEWIGKIPQGWEVGRIKYNYYLKGRIGWQGLKANEFLDDGAYLVTGTDFCNGHVNWDTCYHISEERYNEAPEIHVKIDDLLVTKDGTVGKIAYIDSKPEKVSLNSHLLIVRPINENYKNKFMYWVIQSEIFLKYYQLSQNGTIMASLSQEKISNFSFALPDQEIQIKIADYLDKKCSEIDKLISDKEILIEKLIEYKKSLIYECVTGKRKVI